MSAQSTWTDVPPTATVPDREEEVRAVLATRGRADSAAAVAHLSLLGTESCIGVYDPRQGISPMVELRPLPLRGADLLEDVAGMDENAAKLVGHFTDAFPEVRQKVASIGTDLDDLETPALGWLLLAGRLLISLEQPESIRSDLLGENVRLDTVVVEDGDRFVLDGRWMLRSLMSYRLADVEPAVLARSVSQSLGEFVSSALGRLVQDWPDARSVACAGDVFVSDPLLAAWTRQGLARLSRPVIMPK